jgi:hypothetical protein
MCWMGEGLRMELSRAKRKFSSAYCRKSHNPPDKREALRALISNALPRFAGSVEVLYKIKDQVHHSVQWTYLRRYIVFFG